MKLAPITRFRVHPVGSTLFFSVAVFETKKAMYRYYKKSQRGFKRVGLGFEAIVVSRHTVDYRGKVGRSRPKMGEMLFVRRSLTRTNPDTLRLCGIAESFRNSRSWKEWTARKSSAMR
jgi:hypothetical protein